MSGTRTCGHTGWMSGCAECWNDQHNPARMGWEGSKPLTPEVISEKDRMYVPLSHLKAAILELQVAATAERDAVQSSVLNKYVTRVAELEGELQRLKVKLTQVQSERDSATNRLEHVNSVLEALKS
jgi:hypothetical protein